MKTNSSALAFRIVLLGISIASIYFLIQIATYILGIQGGGYGGIPPIACQDSIQEFNDKVEFIAASSGFVLTFLSIILIEKIIKFQQLQVSKSKNLQIKIWIILKWLVLSLFFLYSVHSLISLLSTLCII